MAITCDLATEFGLKIEGAYIRIDVLRGSKHGMAALANAYLTKTAFDEGKGYLRQIALDFVPDTSKPLWFQAYAALKALPEMAKATDA